MTIITNLRGRAERVTLPAPLWEGDEQVSTGIALEAIYRGPRTGRMFARRFSCWQRANGKGVQGVSTDEIDTDEYLHLCQLVGVEPVGVVAEAV